jgi:hypothetical protein
MMRPYTINAIGLVRNLMPDFTLIHLASQCKAAAAYVEGWAVPEILNWMRQYGKVTEPKENSETRLYSFEAQSGMRDAFYLTESNELVVIVSGWVA